MSFCIRCKLKSDTKVCFSCKEKANITRNIPWCKDNIKRNTCPTCDPKGYIDYIFNFLMNNCKITDSKKDGHIFDLDLPWCYKMLEAQSGLCYHCSVFMSISKGSKDRTQISIDRVDNSQGHCKGNVVLTCLGCNLVKRDKAFKDFGSDENKVVKKDSRFDSESYEVLKAIEEEKLAKLKLEVSHLKKELRFLQDKISS